MSGLSRLMATGALTEMRRERRRPEWRRLVGPALVLLLISGLLALWLR
jgi:hypothetical protein